MSEGNKMATLNVTTSRHAETVIKAIAVERKLTYSRVIAIAIDNELGKDKPFEFDLTLPEEDTCEDLIYADEGGKLLDYMAKIRGAGLDTLILLRHDIGIPDKDTFLATFKECLGNDMIESSLPPLKKGLIQHAEGYLYYHLKGHKSGRSNKMAKNRYKEYLRLHKEFGGEA